MVMRVVYFLGIVCPILFIWVIGLDAFKLGGEMRLNWYAIGFLTGIVLIWSSAFYFIYNIGKENGYEAGKKYVMEIMFEQMDSTLSKTKGKEMFPDNTRYQGLIDEWYNQGVLPVKE